MQDAVSVVQAVAPGVPRFVFVVPTEVSSARAEVFRFVPALAVTVPDTTHGDVTWVALTDMFPDPSTAAHWDSPAVASQIRLAR